MFSRFFAFLSVVVLVCSIPASAYFAQQSDQDDTEDAVFQVWLADVRTEALKRGISQATVDLALADVKLLKRVITRDRNQPEVKQPYARYLKSRVSDWRKDKGSRAVVEHTETLTAVAERFRVQGRFVAAIWGIESNYGTVPITIDVFSAIATLAFDKRRAARFRRELFAALEILDSGQTTIDKMKGSWAGAMGQPQFMPENYLKYGIDFDEDGKIDIWDNPTDVLASIANYLRSYGWRDDQTWGRKVLLPEGGETSLVGKQSEGVAPDRICKPFKTMGVWRDLQDWQALGVRRMDGSKLPPRSIPAALIIGDTGDGYGYLVYRNFCSIMRYNPSFKYALAVGLLSDEIK